VGVLKILALLGLVPSYGSISFFESSSSLDGASPSFARIVELMIAFANNGAAQKGELSGSSKARF